MSDPRFYDIPRRRVRVMVKRDLLWMLAMFVVWLGTWLGGGWITIVPLVITLITQAGLWFFYGIES